MEPGSEKENGAPGRAIKPPTIHLLLASPAVAAAREQELGRIGSGAPDEAASAGTGRCFEVALASGGRARVLLFADREAALRRIGEGPLSSVIIDNREPARPAGFAETVAGRVLPELLAATGSVRMLTRHSIFVVLPDGPETAHHAYAVGTLQLGGVIVAPATVADVLEAICRTVRPPEPGKVALCLAGGGIEGMFYELGVIRALDAHLVGRSVRDFDVFSGISAGAIICAFLANGISPEELALALKGKSTRLDPIRRTMLFDPNFAEVASRLTGAAGGILRGKWLRRPLDAALEITPTAIFSGEKLRRYLERQLTKPGLTNDFCRLAKELYIGATDQDSNTHVTFGEPGLRDVPISHAVRASSAMTPYYPPEQINGRFFVDGIFTRTINLDIAVASGARLVICVDPMAPVQTDEAGYVSSRGGFFNTVQSIKSMVRTRFSELIGRAEEAYPDVAVYVFTPTARDLEEMSGTLMRFFYRTETEDMAFASASERLTRDFAWMAADFERHGFELSRAPVR